MVWKIQTDVEEQRVAEEAVEDRRRGRRHEAAAAVEHHRGGDDRDEVEKRERRVERAGEVDQQRLDQQVAEDLDVQAERAGGKELANADVDQRQAVRERRRQVDV